MDLKGIPFAGRSHRLFYGVYTINKTGIASRCALVEVTRRAAINNSPDSREIYGRRRDLSSEYVVATLLASSRLFPLDFAENLSLFDDPRGRAVG